jgi:hypothetical protein
MGEGLARQAVQPGSAFDDHADLPSVAVALDGNPSRANESTLLLFSRHNPTCCRSAPGTAPDAPSLRGLSGRHGLIPFPDQL